MAVIKCPECGGQISDTVKQCIHCGCKIIRCSECKTISVGERECCPCCGYSFENENKITEKTSAEDYPNAVSARKEWISERFVVRGILEPVLRNYWIAIWIWLLPCLFGIIAYAKIDLWCDMEDLLFAYEDTLNSVKWILVFGAITYVIISAYYGSFASHLLVRSTEKWLVNKGINAKDLLQKSFKRIPTDFNKKTAWDVCISTKQVIQAAMYMTDPSFKKREKNRAILTLVASILVALLLCIFMINNAEMYMSGIFWGQIEKLEFSILQDKWLLYVAVLLFVSRWIYDQIADRKLLKQEAAWIKKHFKSYYPTYNGYIKNYAKAVTGQLTDIGD
ncbi:MAG: zinc ribbon domain-containing protein [Clostridia bacterium]|nr:zinc ribbon domain-containing protein [Clostridia bacterium]